MPTQMRTGRGIMIRGNPFIVRSRRTDRLEIEVEGDAVAASTMEAKYIAAFNAI